MSSFSLSMTRSAVASVGNRLVEHVVHRLPEGLFRVVDNAGGRFVDAAEEPRCERPPHLVPRAKMNSK